MIIHLIICLYNLPMIIHLCHFPMIIHLIIRLLFHNDYTFDYTFVPFHNNYTFDYTIVSFHNDYTFVTHLYKTSHMSPKT